ncbi:MAG: hypothetical protein M3530_00125 [Thermoproteota archaeon]|nr:hypothetical protein [Thermoproteota archaeon]
MNEDVVKRLKPIPPDPELEKMNKNSMGGSAMNSTEAVRLHAVNELRRWARRSVTITDLA